MLGHADGMESARIRDRIGSVVKLLRPDARIAEVSELLDRVHDGTPARDDGPGAS
jgi:hypothetical protein